MTEQGIGHRGGRHPAYQPSRGYTPPNRPAPSGEGTCLSSTGAGVPCFARLLLLQLLPLVRIKRGYFAEGLVQSTAMRSR